MPAAEVAAGNSCALSTTRAAVPPTAPSLQYADEPRRPPDVSSFVCMVPLLIEVVARAGAPS
jgi:hypothetical protein